MPQQSAPPPMQSGRLHRRVPSTVPIKLLDPVEAEETQDGVTENISPRGARIVVKAAMEPDDRLFLESPAHTFRIFFRVVYCEALASGQFAVGLQLAGPSANWTDNLNDRAP